MELGAFTSHDLLDLVQNQVHQGIITLEGTSNYHQGQRNNGLSLGDGGRRIGTLTPAVELDGDLLVHVLGQVENVFLLGSLAVAAGTVVSSAVASAAATSSSPPAAVAASAPPTAASVGSSVRHRRAVKVCSSGGGVMIVCAWLFFAVLAVGRSSS